MCFIDVIDMLTEFDMKDLRKVGFALSVHVGIDVLRGQFT